MLRSRWTCALAAVALLVAPLSAMAQCPSDMVRSGSTCIDRYEASIGKTANQRNLTLRGGSFSIALNSGGTGELAGVYAIDQNGAPNSISDASAAGFRCAK